MFFLPIYPRNQFRSSFKASESIFVVVVVKRDKFREKRMRERKNKNKIIIYEIQRDLKEIKTKIFSTREIFGRFNI